MRARNGVTKQCVHCDASFYVHNYRVAEGRFCTHRCYLAHRWGESHKEQRACVTCGETFTDYKSNTRITCSRRCDNQRKSRIQRGAGSVFWRGGFNFPYVGNWRQQRQRCKERDQHKCVLCGSTDRVQAHHIVPARYGGTHDLDNLQTLCRSCHSKEELKVNAKYRSTLLHGKPRRRTAEQRQQSDAQR